MLPWIIQTKLQDKHSTVSVYRIQIYIYIYYIYSFNYVDMFYNLDIFNVHKTCLVFSIIQTVVQIF